MLVEEREEGATLLEEEERLLAALEDDTAVEVAATDPPCDDAPPRDAELVTETLEAGIVVKLVGAVLEKTQRLLTVPFGHCFEEREKHWDSNHCSDKQTTHGDKQTW